MLPIFVRFKKSGTGTLKETFARLCVCGHLSHVAKSLSSCGSEEIYIRYGNGGCNETMKCAPSDGRKRQLMAVLRNPLARAVSAMHFWGGKGEDRKAFDGIPVSQVTFTNISRYRKCYWDGCWYFDNFNPLTASTLSQTKATFPHIFHSIQ